MSSSESKNRNVKYVPLTIDRQGVEWEDGFGSIRMDAERVYPRQRFPLIPFDQLSDLNLPPFNVKLTDEQVGHLPLAKQEKKITLDNDNLSMRWTADISYGKIRPGRAHLGEGYLNPRGYQLSEVVLNEDCLFGQLHDGDEQDAWPRHERPRIFLSSGRLMNEDPEYQNHIAKAKTAEQGITVPQTNSFVPLKRKRSDPISRSKLLKRDPRNIQQSQPTPMSSVLRSSSVQDSELPDELKDTQEQLATREAEFDKSMAEIFDLKKKVFELEKDVNAQKVARLEVRNQDLEKRLAEAVTRQLDPCADLSELQQKYSRTLPLLDANEKISQSLLNQTKEAQEGVMLVKEWL